jgi:hypothetical protein
MYVLCMYVGILLHLAAMKQEVLAMVTSSASDMNTNSASGFDDTNCHRMKTMAQDVINLWPHSRYSKHLLYMMLIHSLLLSHYTFYYICIN